MKKNAKRLICGLLIIALILTGLPGALMIEKAYGVELYAEDANIGVTGGENAQKEYPASFDLRDRNVVTSVKNQGLWSTCWGFSAIAASEISLLTELTKKEGY